MRLRDKFSNLLTAAGGSGSGNGSGSRRSGTLKIDVTNLSGSTADGTHTPSPASRSSRLKARTPRRAKTPRGKGGSVRYAGGTGAVAAAQLQSAGYSPGSSVDDSKAPLRIDVPAGSQVVQSSPVTPDESSGKEFGERAGSGGKATSLDDESAASHHTHPSQRAVPVSTPTSLKDSRSRSSSASPAPGLRSKSSLRRKKPPPIVATAPPGGGTPQSEPRPSPLPDEVTPLVRVHSDKTPSVSKVHKATVRRPGGGVAGASPGFGIAGGSAPAQHDSATPIRQSSSSSSEDPYHFGTAEHSYDISFSTDYDSFGDDMGRAGRQPPPPEKAARKPEKGGKSPGRRRRPPGLNGVDLAAEPEQETGHQIFGDDGALHANGFTISNGGILAAPDGLQRQRSTGSSIEGVPRSIHNWVVVKSLDELRVTKALGAGASGRVNLSIHSPSGKNMAVKVVNVYDEAKRNQLLKELETLTTHVSRFLVRFYGAFYDGKGAVHIVLEYMDCGALADVIARHGPIPEDVTHQIAVHCIHGLRFLHKSRVLHRDLKTANVLLSRELGRAKLSDFGLAREVNAGVSRADTFVGTLAYMSPERLHGSPYTYASDIWGLGVTIAECLLGRYPFDKPQSYFDYIAVTSRTEDLLPRGKFSFECEDFVRRCTAVDPMKRPPCDLLLKHPWIARREERDASVFARWMDDITAARYESGAA